MKYLLVTATTGEVAPFIDFLKNTASTTREDVFEYQNTRLEWLVTGVGLTATAFALGRKLALNGPYTEVLNAGIAGAFPDRGLQIGEVVEIAEETFADLGAEDAQGNLLSLAELGLMQPDVFPFVNGYMVNNPKTGFDGLKTVRGISVNKTSGYAPSIEALKARFEPGVESMEGAAFFYACLLSRQNFAAVRSISNFVEPRNRENWNIPLAIKNLNDHLIKWWLSRSGR